MFQYFELNVEYKKTMFLLDECQAESKGFYLFLQRDTDEEVKEHLLNNLHLQEKVIYKKWIWG